MDPESRGSADSSVMRYRPDIDGLRAIAVLAVIFFHLSRTILPGGYLGVDMFFVVSGFLITSIVWREVRARQFSIAEFYDRRIRRIMPALLVLLIAVTAAAAIFLLPADLIEYGQSLLATLGFVANIYFWRDTNYFSRAAEFKPLLHIWSLGIEEQFYIFFPLMLALVARWRMRAAFPAIAAMTVGSLAANIVIVSKDGATPAFFLLPFRAWELGFGASLALLPNSAWRGGATAGFGALCGLLLVIFGISYPAQTAALHLPESLPVVIGTATIIQTGQHAETMVSKALRVRLLVFIGLISYSLYLWHWPIIVFGQYYLVRDFTLAESLAALVLMFACAIASWWFIERPFRSRRIAIRNVLNAAGAAAIVLAIGSTGLIYLHGLPGRLNAPAARLNEAVGEFYRCELSSYVAFGASRACVLNLPTREPSDADVILIGNSHAVMYAPLFRDLLVERRQHGLLIPLNGCLPTLYANISRTCIDAARGNLVEALRLNRAQTVIIGLTWPDAPDALVDEAGRILDNRAQKSLIVAIDDLIDRLRAAGKKVVLIGPVAEPGYDIASIISRQLAFGQSVSGPTYVSRTEFIDRFGVSIAHFEARPDITFARPDRVQCRQERCDFLIDGDALFADSNHVARAQLFRYRAIMMDALPAIEGRNPGVGEESR